MSRAVIRPGRLSGTAAAPPSKSAAHRAILCAALANGTSELAPIGTSADMEATIGCIKALGALPVRRKNTLSVTGIAQPPQMPVTLDCAESGSTLRFLIPLAAALGVPATFIGRGRLPQRPLGVYRELLPLHGVSVESKGGLPLRISGRLLPGVYCLPGDVSSQFITGLLLALPLLPANSELRLTTPLQSAAYVEMTCDALRTAGIVVHRTQTGWQIPGGQQYRACRWNIEGDWSQAAFLLAAGALSGPVTVTGLQPQSVQSDRAIASLLQQFGARLQWQENALTVHAAPLHGIRADVSQIPDLAPVLAAVGACAQGPTLLHHAARLRLKESDRLHAMKELITALGGKAEETEDTLQITGTGKPLAGGTIHGFNDHRIVMAAAVAALHAADCVTVTDAQAIRKSWPEFFTVYRKLGGIADVILG